MRYAVLALPVPTLGTVPQGKEKTHPTGLTADGLLCYTGSTVGVVIAPVIASG